MAKVRASAQHVAPSAVPIRPDGRRLRAEESRRRVVEALLHCVREGDFEPSAETVALRAGVGLRTVFRLFTDKEGLFRHMSEAVRAQMAVTANAPLRGQSWREHLDDLMKRRFAAFEQIMPYRRAAQAHAHQSATVRANHRSLQQAMHEALAAILPPKIVADRATLEAMDLALCADAWIRLRMDQGLTPAQARATLRRIVTCLVDDAGEA